MAPRRSSSIPTLTSFSRIQSRPAPVSIVPAAPPEPPAQISQAQIEAEEVLQALNDGKAAERELSQYENTPLLGKEARTADLVSYWDVCLL